MEFYCIKTEGTDALDGWFTTEEKLKEYYDACVQAYPRVKFVMVKVQLNIDFDWKTNMIDGCKPRNNFPFITKLTGDK